MRPIPRRPDTTRTDREDDAGPVAAADDDVLRPGRAVDEVPLPQRALFALDEQECLAGKDEKVFLVSFPVVDRDRRTRREHAKEDADLRELSLTLKLAARRLALAMEPTGVASVQDEPSLPGRHEPGLGLFERGLRDHPRSIREPVPPSWRVLVKPC